MSPLQPDQVDVWVFRDRAGAAGPGGSASELQILMLRRAPGDILPGLWQPVSGGLEADEPIVAGALRELLEETGFGPDRIAAFYQLDQVNFFHEPTVAGIVTSVDFAVRVPRDAEPTLSAEHNSYRWVSPDEALELAVWPAYRESIKRIVENLLDPEREPWFALTLAGRRPGE